MKSNSRRVVFAGTVGALYVLLTVLQSALFPGSVSGPVQFRAAEALMMFSLFSAESVYGLTIGCIVANIISGVVPLDIVIGSGATLLSGVLIYKTRSFSFKRPPILAILFPTLCNGILVGGEIQLFYIGGYNFLSMLTQIGLVMLGEACVLCAIGLPLYYAMQTTKLQNYMK